MKSLTRKHPFLDGNKRTGATAAGLFLRLKGYRLTASNEELVDITMRVAQSQSSFADLATWFQDNSRSIK